MAVASAATYMVGGSVAVAAQGGLAVGALHGGLASQKAMDPEDAFKIGLAKGATTGLAVGLCTSLSSQIAAKSATHVTNVTIELQGPEGPPPVLQSIFSSFIE